MWALPTILVNTAYTGRLRGDHVARWTAAGLLEAEKKFRRVKGFRELKELNRILNSELHPQVQVA